MIGIALVQCGLYLAVLTALAIPLGAYMARVYEGKAEWAQKLLGPLERTIYRLSGIRPDEDMSWRGYTAAVLMFNLLGVLAVYALQRMQAFLPLNPAGLGAVSPELAFNTATSFATNTNWQSYGGESTMSHLTQMMGLAVQNFVSAAAGMAVLIALIRGFTRRLSDGIGSFWVDLVRSTVYILLPLSLVVSLALVWQGVPQTFEGSAQVTMLETLKAADGKTITDQPVALGPVASQIAIKQLGTNGGGYYNVNSAHPLENPTPLADFIEVLSILLVPAACCFMFGRMVAAPRQGLAIYAAMLLIFIPVLAATVWAEQAGNPLLSKFGVDQTASATQPGGNMEGKELRNGIIGSARWAIATTAASNGSVNAMHDSFMPLGGMLAMWMMQLGEVVFGGVGSGLYGMLAFALVAVFVAGLMVGRTPEYLGKKIEAFEMKMTSLVILIPPAAVLLGTALACATEGGRAGVFNPGPHGFSEILYAFSSAGNNNGSAFGGLGASSAFYTTSLGLVMLIARYWLMVPILAIAGSLARKKHVPASSGTLPTDTPLFVVLLAGIVILVGALTFVPALALGPVAEHFISFAN